MQSNETDTEGNLVIHYDDTLEDFFELTKFYQNLKGQLKDQIRRVLDVVNQYVATYWLTFDILLPDVEDYQDGKLVWLSMHVEWQNSDKVKFENCDLTEGFPVEWLYLDEKELIERLKVVNHKKTLIDNLYQEWINSLNQAKLEYQEKCKLIAQEYKDKISVSGL